MALRKGKFSMECFPEGPFIGYTYGETWNGWACPFFTYLEAVKIVMSMNKHADSSGGVGVEPARYDHETDSFVFFDGDTDEPDIFHAEILDGMKLYPIGNRCWCWWDETW